MKVDTASDHAWDSRSNAHLQLPSAAASLFPLTVGRIVVLYIPGDRLETTIAFALETRDIAPIIDNCKFVSDASDRYRDMIVDETYT